MTAAEEPSHVPPPSRAAVRAAYAAFAAATVGFQPLHLTWALGIPLFADRDRFAVWYADGGRAYLIVLCLLAVLPAILALALVRPWGLRFPNWTPIWRGRPVPRLVLLVPGYGLALVLGAYTVFAAVLALTQWSAQDAVFSPWTGVWGIPQFAVWVYGLAVATRSYDRRTGRRLPRSAA